MPIQLRRRRPVPAGQSPQPEPRQPEPTPVAAPVAAAPKEFKFDITKSVAFKVEQTPLPEATPETPTSKQGKPEPAPLPGSVQSLVNAIASTDTSVQQELIGADGQAVTVTVQRKNNAAMFELMRQHDIFEYPRMEIGVGKINASLSFADLGVSKEQLETLKKINAKGAKIEMFPALKDAGNELRGMLGKVKLNMTYTGGSWICADSQLPETAIGLEKIHERCGELQQKVIQAIPAGKRVFLEQVAAMVIATNTRLEEDNEGLEPERQRPLVDLETVLMHYAAQFPTAQDVSRWLRFEVDGPIHTPSLTQQAEGNARLKEAMNRFQSAKLQKAELDAVERAFHERQRKVQEAVASGMEYAKAQVLKTFADMVGSLAAATEKGSIHGSTKKALPEAITKLKKLLEMPFVPDSFSELVADAERFQGMVQSETWSKEQMQQQLDAALHKLTAKYEYTPPKAEVGHRAGYVPTRQKPSTISTDAHVA